jgi:hypothetical protein
MGLCYIAPLCKRFVFILLITFGSQAPPAVERLGPEPDKRTQPKHLKPTAGDPGGFFLSARSSLHLFFYESLFDESHQPRPSH